MAIADMNLSAQCIKYLLFVLNFLMVITGIILIAVGSSTQSKFFDYSHFLENDYFSIPTLLITVGIIIFIIAFFGCYGAIRENYCMILTFAALMVVIFFLELFAGIYGYALRGGAQGVIKEKMFDSMKNYAGVNQTEVTELWDSLQDQFECCGTDTPQNWVTIWNDSHAEWSKQHYLPMSCCDIPFGAVGTFNCTWIADEKKAIYHKEGCLVKVSDFIRSHALSLGGAGIGIAFCQLLGIGFALFLARTIRKSYLNM